ncbi:MAG TPA: hypothetical protein PLQ97_10520 [Myxococcota bacterium]|nr:hypothetical protein [Myxococcota bacterium]HQK51255.1 hypothetical protein [Myxococcota bacterium]
MKDPRRPLPPWPLRAAAWAWHRRRWWMAPLAIVLVVFLLIWWSEQGAPLPGYIYEAR